VYILSYDQRSKTPNKIYGLIFNVKPEVDVKPVSERVCPGTHVCTHAHASGAIYRMSDSTNNVFSNLLG